MKILMTAAMALTLTALPAMAQDLGQNGMTFDLDGGACDSDSYAYFNTEGMVLISTGSRYVGDGEFYLESPDSVTEVEGGLVRFEAVSVTDSRKVFWTVHPDGFFTSSEGYDATTITMEGAVDVGRMTPCGN